MVFTLLAEALPSQSAFFISLILVQHISTSLELLRISPVVVNAIRKVASNKLGHNLTDKERNGAFMGLSPLDNPTEVRVTHLLLVLVQLCTSQIFCSTPSLVSFLLAQNWVAKQSWL